MKTKYDYVRMLACAGVSLGATYGVGAQEQEPSRSLLEEVIVTAERRSESILEVPLSITAYGDTMREQMGIMSIQDMVNFAPGVSFNMATDRPSIRGIARQSNFFSLDSPVANYFDGVYTSSVQDAQRRPIFVERTEILRGPQGALSGRGSIAGAINTYSKRPTSEFQAEVGAFTGNYDRYGGEMTVSGPLLGEAMRVRLNGGVYRQDKGYFDNVSSGQTEGDQPNNRQVFDLLIDGALGDNFEYFLKASFADYDESRRTGVSTSPFYAGNLSAPSPYGIDGALMPLAAYGLFPGSGGVRLGDVPNNPAFLSEDNYRQFANDFHSRQKLDDHHNYTAHLTWHTGPVDIKWIGGHQNYLYQQWTDYDSSQSQASWSNDVLQMRLPATPAFPTGRLVSPGGTNLYLEQREWYSNELTFASTTDSRFSWIFGLYQSNEDYFQEPSTQSFSGYPELNNPIRFIGGVPTFVQPNDTPFASVRGYFNGETVSRAAYGQIAFDFTDQWKATLGVRYNEDEKDVREAFRYIGNNVSAGLAPILAGGGLGAPRALDVTPAYDGSPLQPGVVADHGIDPADGYRKRDFYGEWDELTGSVGLDFKPTPNQLIYGRVARGYRPGGFNAGFNYNPPMVDKETVNSYEVGWKGTLFDRLQLSTSAFLYDYRDIQLSLPVLGRCSDPNDLSTCTTLNSFINLPKGESRGVEIEANYAITDNWSMYLSYGWLDTEIKEGVTEEGQGFQNPDDPAGLLPNANRYQQIPNQLDTYTYLPRWTQDLSGNSLANSPEHRVAVNTAYTFEFAPGNLTASLSYVWRAEQYSDVFETEPAIVPDFFTLGARLLWTDASDRYTVILYGSNLTDENAADSAGTDRRRTGLATPTAPSSLGQAFFPTYNWQPPREYGIELQYRFGSH
ncbi:iron complex outermembrane receptor protein [Povalibacter uvarum]|uniref:Iron complex outermembrane receptor protein n=1 Tax=Povalibacter uvarum TaxID=732238 RepID=A0A841HEE0_9GAMM|nr:TonB-dependent receptor [Povalibacter uvarum]MBB6091491.1 iron complex outermembrane receptor protein [Povalibacter uvarum]